MMVVDVDDAANVRTMLCMPIVNANKDVIGVAQLINKVKFTGAILELARLSKQVQIKFYLGTLTCRIVQ